MKLIDADELIKTITENVYTIIHDWNSIEPGMSLYGIMQAIDEQPIIDAVPVVRCKDCVNAQHDELFGLWYCNGREVMPEDYCSYGERKTAESE